MQANQASLVMNLQNNQQAAIQQQQLQQLATLMQGQLAAGPPAVSDENIRSSHVRDLPQFELNLMRLRWIFCYVLKHLEQLRGGRMAKKFAI